MTIPAVEEVGRALEVAPAWFRPFIAVCAFAGLRLGEAAALRLEVVDFLRRTISVRHQLQGASNDSTELVAPKFGSERVVYVPAQLVALLAEHVRRSGVRQGDWLVRNGRLGRSGTPRRRSRSASTPTSGHGRGPHARRSGRPDRRRAGRDVRTFADQEAPTGR
jgi:integrase